MASEEKAVGQLAKEEKEKDRIEEVTTEPSSSVPNTTATPPVPETRKEQDGEIKTQPPSSLPTAPTAPPIPEKDEETAPPLLPPRPLSHVQAPSRPLPPPMNAHVNEQGSRLPEIFPVSYYDPTDVRPHDAQPAPLSQGWHKTKLVLSTISLICSVAVIGLGLAVASWGGTFSIQEAILGVTGSTAALAIFWIAVDNVVTCLSRGRHRIAPGAHVALHLIIWLMIVASITVVALHGETGYYSWEYRGYYDEIGRLETAILALMVILLLIHFLLFIRACVETHEVNLMAMRNKQTIVRYVQVPVPVDSSGAPLFPDAPPGTAYPQPYPQMATMSPAVPHGPNTYGQPQGSGIPVPQQVLFGGYYAPTGPQIDPSVYNQPPASTLLHGYYGPPPAPSSGSASNSSARRHSQRSGSGSRRASQQNPSPSATPKYV